MKIIESIPAFRQLRCELTAKTIGFVPTMGNLHQGHSSLYQKSRAENDISIASLFINPTQFNREDDFLHYPRTLDQDLKQLANNGVDYCLLPDKDTIYPDNYRYQIQETCEGKKREGLHRPGHFTGMLTIVMKLLQLVQPHRAYFGEKDYQQYELIAGMVEAFFINTDIIVCPTVREPEGLACSSRNNRLTPAERSLANQFAATFLQPSKELALIQQEIEALGVKIDYLEQVGNRRFVAVHIGGIRLIDNYAISG